MRAKVRRRHAVIMNSGSSGSSAIAPLYQTSTSRTQRLTMPKRQATHELLDALYNIW